jgi:hypothetical protein
MPEKRKLERAALCYCLLALITLAVCLPVIEARFITFDDTSYVTENPTVQAGLTWEGFRWAFTQSHAANWHPLSWLSHMLDSQLYALKPAGHEALKLQPDFPEALNNLAWLLAANPDPQVRNGREAVDLAERACRLTDYKQPPMIGTLAAAYAEAGRFTEAATAAEKARTAADQCNQPALAARNRELVELYRSGQAVRDTP